MSTLFKSPSVKLLHNASCFIFSLLFSHWKVFCICFSSSRTEFGINVSNAKDTILEIAIAPKLYNIISLFYRVTKIFIVLELFIICAPNILIHLFVRSKHFTPQSTLLTLFSLSTPIPAISPLVKLGTSPGSSILKTNSSLLKQL